MWAVFSQRLEKKAEEKPVIRKTFSRIFTLAIASGIIFSFVIYEIFYLHFINSQENRFLIFMILVVSSIFVGCAITLLVFNSIFMQLRRIIYELSTETPNWDFLEREYMGSDIRNSYLAIKKLHNIVSSQSRLVGIAEVASRTAHDIRSPLTALELVVKDISHLSEEKRILIRNSANRIRQIADNLLNRYKNYSPNFVKKYPEHIMCLILDVVSEKHVQYKMVPIKIESYLDESAFGAFANVVESDLKCIISNLIDNSIEALAGCQAGYVHIKLSKQNNNILIEIVDNGSGMTTDALSKVSSGEMHSEKETGNGLGLSCAVKIIRQEWGGNIFIDSCIDRGTSIKIVLNLVDTPHLFASALEIMPAGEIAILDDDQLIHQIWLNRIGEISERINIKSFYNPHELIANYKNTKFTSHIIFLIDYELFGYDLSGLDVITTLDIANHSYLVTGSHDNPEIISKCNKFGIKIIPKNLAVYIPLYIHKNIDDPDLIIIDDSEILTASWSLSAKQQGKIIATFNKITSFRSVMMKYRKNIPIYIDFDLKNDASGIDFLRELHENGFNNLYLISGYPSSHFPQFNWIKGVRDKTPPF